VVCVGPAGGTQKKRGRGRPPKSETLARRQAEQKAAEERRAASAKPEEPQQAEEEDDEIVDAGAIDDPAGAHALWGLCADSHRHNVLALTHISSQWTATITPLTRRTVAGRRPLPPSPLLFLPSPPPPPPLRPPHKDVLAARWAAPGSTGWQRKATAVKVGLV